jgi:hypothetical protein
MRLPILFLADIDHSSRLEARLQRLKQFESQSAKQRLAGIGLLSLLRRYQTLIIVRLLQAVSCWLPSVILSLQSMMVRFNLMWGSTSTSNFASMLRNEANASLAIVWA